MMSKTALPFDPPDAQTARRSVAQGRKKRPTASLDEAAGIARFDGTAWTAYPTDQFVGEFRAAVDANGSLWMAAGDQLISFDGTTTNTYPTPFTHP